MIDAGEATFTSTFSYSKWRVAWYSFLSLLDISYDGAFSCPDCGDSPESVVMDGITLGARKLFLPPRENVKNDDVEQLDG